MPDTEPSVWTLALIFWTALATGIAALAVVSPELFGTRDPDSLLRLVQVRDLLGGQAWFDMMQHRLDPPAGTLMHWSRLVDAPIAALVLAGDVFGNGERFALIAWPLLLLLGLMAAVAQVATHLAGRAAAVPALILTMLFPMPTMGFLPNRIDHHNAQLVLLIGTLACVMRLRRRPAFGVAAGALSALMLAIGLEMLPYLALLGAAIALHWAATGEAGRSTAGFAIAFGPGALLLHMATSSPAAAFACDSLSWAYVAPALAAGLGLTALTVAGSGWRAELRFAGLAALGLAAAGALLLVAPECLAGPYGGLTDELEARWLATVIEAHPVHRYALRDPDGLIGILGPPLVALAVALRRGLMSGAEGRLAWLLAAGLVLAALALSFYQVRTLPYANGVAIPVLAAWLTEKAAGPGFSLRSWRAGAPLVAALLLAMPTAHLALGWAAVRGLAAATDTRIAPAAPPPSLSAAGSELSGAAAECQEPASDALLAAAPPGLVMAPVFLGPTVLTLSAHAVVAGPYHRAGRAILDSLDAMERPASAARPILQARGVDYVAICAASKESARVARNAPDGLLASLLAGKAVPWLEPVSAPPGETALRLWRLRP